MVCAFVADPRSQPTGRPVDADHARLPAACSPVRAPSGLRMVSGTHAGRSSGKGQCTARYADGGGCAGCHDALRPPVVPLVCAMRRARRVDGDLRCMAGSAATAAPPALDGSPGSASARPAWRERAGGVDAAAAGRRRTPRPRVVERTPAPGGERGGADPHRAEVHWRARRPARVVAHTRDRSPGCTPALPSRGPADLVIGAVGQRA
jgi:hypothetical protein